MGNNSCPAIPVLPKDPTPFISNGNINFKAHDVGWIISGSMAIIAIITSFWLIDKHLRFFYCPSQQRHIVRILMMVPIYSIYSFLSYYYYPQALYFQLLRDCYESIVIASFFHLLLSYLSSPPPTPEDPLPQPFDTREERLRQLRKVFRGVKVGKWMFPLGFVKWRPAGGGDGEGEGFLWLMRICIGQYVIVRPLTTLASVIGQATGIYCLSSWSPRFLHVYMSALVSISVTVAMYAVLQLYMPLTKELAPYSPVLKFISVKTIVFLTFWQDSILSLFQQVGWIKDHQYWSANSICIGISALLSCLEMMVFGFVHIRAFSYLPYRSLAKPISSYLEPTASPTSYPTSFNEWTKLEAQAARDHSLQSRLRALPPESPRHTKADGTPLLRQTKRSTALWKCLRITDIFRELGEESHYVIREVVWDNKGGGEGEKILDRDEIFVGAFGERRLEAGEMRRESGEDVGLLAMSKEVASPTFPFAYLPYGERERERGMGGEESRLYEPREVILEPLRDGRTPVLPPVAGSSTDKETWWSSWRGKATRNRPQVSGRPAPEELNPSYHGPFAEMMERPRSIAVASTRIPRPSHSPSPPSSNSNNSANSLNRIPRHSLPPPIIPPLNLSTFNETFAAAPELGPDGSLNIAPPHRLSSSSSVMRSTRPNRPSSLPDISRLQRPQEPRPPQLVTPKPFIDLRGGFTPSVTVRPLRAEGRLPPPLPPLSPNTAQPSTSFIPPSQRMATRQMDESSTLTEYVAPRTRRTSREGLGRTGRVERDRTRMSGQVLSPLRNVENGFRFEEY